MFEKILPYADHLGVYCEEFGRTGEQLTDFSQAVARLVLIGAAINLDRQLG